MPALTRLQSIVVFAVLALLMAATRFHHFGSALHLPDASLAVFLLAGLYLSGWLAFALLLAGAGLIDYVAITAGGVSDFCITPAYGFLVPAYGVMWLAGRWARAHVTLAWRALPFVFGAALVSASIAFLISNGAFYLFSGRIAEMSLAHYLEQAGRYALPYVSAAFFYVVATAFVHWAVAMIAGLRAGSPLNRKSP